MYIISFVLDLTQLIDEIKKDYSAEPINSLCCTKVPLEGAEDLSESTSYAVKCFEVAQPLYPILLDFHIFSDQYPNELFQQIWKSKLKEVAKSKTNLTFDDVAAKIWKPIVEECQQLIDTVKYKTITLKAVDHHFRDLDRRDINLHLTSLFRATEACLNRTDESTAWIRNAVDLMVHYWSLCEQAVAAKTVIKLRDTLKLTGNFEIIESVASTFASCLDKATLDDISQKLIDAKSFLEQFTRDRNKLECLESFASCWNIVEWIRKESQGIGINFFLIQVAILFSSCVCVYRCE